MALPQVCRCIEGHIPTAPRHRSAARHSLLRCTFLIPHLLVPESIPLVVYRFRMRIRLTSNQFLPGTSRGPSGPSCGPPGDRPIPTSQTREASPAARPRPPSTAIPPDRPCTAPSRGIAPKSCDDGNANCPPWGSRADRADHSSCLQEQIQGVAKCRFPRLVHPQLPSLYPHAPGRPTPRPMRVDQNGAGEERVSGLLSSRRHSQSAGHSPWRLSSCPCCPQDRCVAPP